MEHHLTTTNQTQNMLEIIAQAASSASVDPAKFHSILDAQERILNRAAEEQFNTDFLALQEALPPLTKDGAVKNKSGGVQSRYVKFETIQKVITPVMRRYGFSISYDIDEGGQDILVRATLRHRGGHKVTYGPMRLPRDESGNKNLTQGAGSSFSYGKRYIITAILDLNAGEEDTDGVAPSFITPAQAQTIISALGGRGERVGKFCQTYGLTDVRELAASDFDKVMTLIKKSNDKKAA